jgi:hypothetical protein
VANRVLREPESLRISYSIFWLQERVLKGFKKHIPILRMRTSGHACYMLLFLLMRRQGLRRNGKMVWLKPEEIPV